MSLGRKYVVLTDALPSTEIPHLLGRVAEQRSQPHRSYAPLYLKPRDILPSLAESNPVTWRSGREFYSDTTGWSLGGGLSELVIGESTWGKERGVTIESDTIKSYQMSNTWASFQRLMKHQEYAADVKDLLERSKSGHAYFVTGFLTAASGTLTTSNTTTRSASLQLTAPILQALGVSLIAGGVGNPQVTPGFNISSSTESKREIVEEVVFAISYDLVRTSRSVDFDSKGWVKKTIVNEGPKRGRHTLVSSGRSTQPEALDLDLGFSLGMESPTMAGHGQEGAPLCGSHGTPYYATNFDNEEEPSVMLVDTSLQGDYEFGDDEAPHFFHLQTKH